MTSKKLQLAAAAASGLVAGCILVVSIQAQKEARIETPGVEPRLLVTGPLAQCPGKQVTIFTGNFEPGAQTPIHRHPGTEILYVLEGEGVMHIRGRDSRELIQGRVVLVEPEAGHDAFIHQAVNLSSTEGMKTLVVVIHDQGVPPGLPLADRQN